MFTGEDKGIQERIGRGGTLYWRGVWGPATGNAYILKILMTAENCKEKKDRSISNGSTANVLSPSLTLSLSLSLS